MRWESVYRGMSLYFRKGLSTVRQILPRDLTIKREPLTPILNFPSPYRHITSPPHSEVRCPCPIWLLLQHCSQRWYSLRSALPLQFVFRSADYMPRLRKRKFHQVREVPISVDPSHQIAATGLGYACPTHLLWRTRRESGYMTEPGFDPHFCIQLGPFFLILLRASKRMSCYEAPANIAAT